MDTLSNAAKRVSAFPSLAKVFTASRPLIQAIRIRASAMVARLARFDILFMGFLALICTAASFWFLPTDPVAIALKTTGALAAFVSGSGIWKNLQKNAATSTQLAEAVDADANLLERIGATQTEHGIEVSLDLMFEKQAQVIETINVVQTDQSKRRAAVLNCLDYIGTIYADFPGFKRQRNDRLLSANPLSLLVGSASQSLEENLLTIVLPMTTSKWEEYIGDEIGDNGLSGNLVAPLSQQPDIALIFAIATDKFRPDGTRRRSRETSEAILVTTLLHVALLSNARSSIECAWSAGDENMDPLWKALNFRRSGERTGDKLVVWRGEVAFKMNGAEPAAWFLKMRERCEG